MVKRVVVGIVLVVVAMVIIVWLWYGHHRRIVVVVVVVSVLVVVLSSSCCGDSLRVGHHHCPCNGLVIKVSKQKKKTYEGGKLCCMGIGAQRGPVTIVSI